jgi:hemolysin activation/secretion protein
MESAGRFKLNGFLFFHLLLPCVAAAASIDPAVVESLRQQQRQIQLEQQRLEQGVISPLPWQPTALPSPQNHVTDES